ncbi:MAG: hypothetical protein JNN07_23550 [Verrucomicrobiales bacterium]|nr:hypothetical protein [Verrucomicrobiales bacterium]
MKEDYFGEAGRKRPSEAVHIQQGEPNWVWATVCTENREPWLTCQEAHLILREVWSSATMWLVSDYILMPDHLHFFAAPRQSEYPFTAWVTYWKRQCRNHHQHPAWKWQAGVFHHRLRNDESYAEKWSYLRGNPVRDQLVKKEEDWPFQGRIHDIRW